MPRHRRLPVFSCVLIATVLAVLPKPAAAAAATDVGLPPEVRVTDVVFYYQTHNLSCEEAAVSMALTHQGIVLDQDEILHDVGADQSAVGTDADGRMRWGDPYRKFVGSVDGFEFDRTGYGAFYPPLVAEAKKHGARILRAGAMDAQTVYGYLWSAHPVVVWATWDWRWHKRNDYLAYDGRWVPWIGPYDAHVYTAVGIRPGAILVNDPLRGRYWVSMQAFEAAYSDFEDAIAFA